MSITKEKTISNLFIFISILGRIIPHPFNATPVGAISLVSGAKLGRTARWVTPFAALIVSDILLNTFVYGFQREWWWVFPFSYASFAINILLGQKIVGPKRWRNLLTFSLVASAQFFVLSNFGAWIASPLYPKTVAGLAECYFMAIPFFQNTLLGDLAWSTGLFFVLERVQVRLRSGKFLQTA